LLDLEESVAEVRAALASLSKSWPANSSFDADVDDWDVSVLVHDNLRSPCELAHALHDTDVLVTPHGFQSMLLLFLPSPAIIFEVFPTRYFKQVYRILAHEFGQSFLVSRVRFTIDLQSHSPSLTVVVLIAGLVHGHVHSPPTSLTTLFLRHLVRVSECVDFYLCRSLARQQNVL
jgi:hypothetical protein